MYIQFTLPGIEQPQQALCEVRWIRESRPWSDTTPGMALRFVALEAETRQLVKRFVRKRSPMFHDEG